MITYNDYPALLFLSYNKDNAPDELPFEVSSEAVRDYLTTAMGYHELFAYIAVVNTLKGGNTNIHYYLTDATFNQVEYNDRFRNECFGNFFTNYVKPGHGVISFKNGGQYVYLLLGKNDTKKLKNADGRYMAVALFKNNFFIGFEEAIITDRGLQVMQTGRYDGGMDIGGYLSFCIITLSFANGRTLLPADNNETSENIYSL